MTLMVRMKKVPVEEKRLDMAFLLKLYNNPRSKEDCFELKEVKGMAKEMVLYKMDDIPVIADAFAKDRTHVEEIFALIRKIQDSKCSWFNAHI